MISAEDMMKSLDQFCDDNNVERVSKQKFGASMGRANGRGFFKTRKSDGTYYQVYGCTLDDLQRPFVIANEDMLVAEYRNERGTFIGDDD